MKNATPNHPSEWPSRQGLLRYIRVEPLSSSEQIARLHRHRTDRKPETVCLVTSRPASELSPEQ